MCMYVFDCNSFAVHFPCALLFLFLLGPVVFICFVVCTVAAVVVFVVCFLLFQFCLSELSKQNASKQHYCCSCSCFHLLCCYF